MLYGDRQRLHSIGCSYDTTVAIGLFLEGVVLLYQAMVVAVEFLIPLDGTEISGLKQHRGHEWWGLGKTVGIVKHGDDTSYNVAFVDESQVARICRVIGINGFQPVIVTLGTVD